MYNKPMKKSFALTTIFAVALLCSCTSAQNSATQIYFDTAVSLSADCSDEVLSGAFLLCEKYENTLSRTKQGSEVSLMSSGSLKASADTLEVINKGLYYSNLTAGRFDITTAPLLDIWDFYKSEVPSNDEISEALQNVDYHSVEISGDTVNTNGKRIDLGAIAKGYIADKLIGYFEDNNVKSGIINLGGNIAVFGDRYYNIGVKRPFYDDISATLRLKNKCVSTSGIYERYFESNGVLYHHIIDTATGFPAETDLLSASVVGDTSADCDALSTICILYGLTDAEKLIENTENFEAVFIDKNYELHITSGLKTKGDVIVLR